MRTPDSIAAADGPGGSPLGSASDPNGDVTVFESMEKQLGLKLLLQKRPMPVVVIDHIERTPTGN